MRRGPSGSLQVGPSAAGEPVRCFVPAPLPPRPALVLDSGLRDRMDDALLALGRLDSVSALLPDPALFLYLYVRKEAVLSSQIEGTQSSLSDLLLFETDAAPGAPLEDVREVSSYVRALEHGMQRIRAGFPLSGRLLREVHRELLAHGRGSEKLPGEFRRSQNWIGGARPGVATFVPPPPEEVAACIADLEKFIHDQCARASSSAAVAVSSPVTTKSSTRRGAATTWFVGWFAVASESGVAGSGSGAPTQPAMSTNPSSAKPRPK
jgi:hypothetical protein